MRLVVDTNVLVSGLLRAGGPPARIVDSLLRESYRALYDDRLLAEYRTVLPRPKFGFDQSAVAVFVDFIAAAGERIVAEPCRWQCSDPSDQPFLEVAVAGAADALVTGNRKHFPADAPVPVLAPAALVSHSQRF